MSRFGVIDLGTNTFHILIVDNVYNSIFEEVYRERRFVKLAEESIESIGIAPFERGLKAMRDYAKILQTYSVEKVRAIGTAALRSADNGKYFIDQVFEETGLRIEIISGEEEARFIHLGVKLAIESNEGTDLIMDIGGGSVECIFFNRNEVLKAFSFPAGVAILFKKFHTQEPISKSDVDAAESFLKSIFQPALMELVKHQKIRLVGASGAFEVVENILVKEKNGLSAKASVSEFLILYKRVLQSNLQERLNIKGIPANRVDLIVVAFILVNFVIQNGDVEEIIVCDYAMKEGVLIEMMNNAKSDF
ncbi:MAG: hypothetical protein NXI23_00875 [Bacteroidetes bacterium]|jgi:exopolyphosphatase/guanosine-5'-triphosphate,3'-diphosphate pyrophosphatase|nr:hypothetical protein [Bacteroidota bacterium]MDF1863864.1 hypothetical protein [Saprospiraceae bacterium]